MIYLRADDRGRKSRAARRAVPLARPLRGRPRSTELLCPAGLSAEWSGLLGMPAATLLGDLAFPFQAG